MTLTGSLLDVPVTVTAPPQLLAKLAEEFTVLFERPPGPGPACELRLHEDGTVDGAVTGREDPRAAATLEQAVQNALAELTRLVLARSPLLCIHAGVVAGADGLVVIPGASGHGKTTLVAALTQAGFPYVSDEVLAIDRSTQLVTPFPRPLALDARSCGVLGLGPATPSAPGMEHLMQPTALGVVGAAGVVTDIVLSYRRDSPPTFTATNRGGAVTSLLSHAFNHYRAGPASLRTVLSLVRNSRVWAAEYRNATELVGPIVSRLGRGSVT